MRPGLCVRGNAPRRLGAVDTLGGVVREIPPEPTTRLALRADTIASGLDRIPGAWERMQLGREHAARGEMVDLDALQTAPPPSRLPRSRPRHT